jgi:N-acyl-L-homoserine lactone synthetase
VPNERTPRWLESADALASALLDRARPVRFRVASTDEELEAVFRLRYRISVERRWKSPDEMPNGIERDEYDDDDAAQIGGWDGGTLVATARVVYPVAGRRLPTEESFDVVAEPKGRVADASRLIVAPEYRDPERRVLGGLAASIWIAMAARGCPWAAVAVTDRIIELCKTLGFDVVVLGPPREYWGEQRRPALLSPPDPGAWDLTTATPGR